jgi:DNA-directed RNA polymerase alpha subunit
MSQILISCKESRIENNRSFYGCFNLGPFEAGHSLTVANALRRTLLSECTGVAIVSVMIENVHHEYSTLPGVRDSILDILLNLKELILKKNKNHYGVSASRALRQSSKTIGARRGLGPTGQRHKSIDSVYESVGESFFRPVIGYLKVRGPGVIRAKDLRLPAFIQCVDPEQYIATLGDDGFLNMKFIIMEGKNYILGKATRDSSLLLKRDSLVQSLTDLIQPAGRPSPKEFDGVTGSRSRSAKGAEAKRVDDRATIAGKAVGPKGSEPRAHLHESSFCNNATQLYLDAVFNPVTKVNYIIEANENKLVENSNKKYALIEDISALINSTDHLKTAFPFLPVLGGLPLKTGNNTKELMEYVANLSTMECTNLYNSLHPLKKESTTHNIILEIWTNGSLHPRDALSTAFGNLSNVFLNLQQTEIMNPVFNDWSAYKKTQLAQSANRGLGQQPPSTSNAGTEGLPINASALIDMDSLNRTTTFSYRGLDISTLNISLRTYTKLKNLGIRQVGDLLSNWNAISTQVEKKTVKDIIKSLKEINLV